MLHAHYARVIAQCTLNNYLVSSLAEDQANRQLIIGMTKLIIHCSKVKPMLSANFRLDASSSRLLTSGPKLREARGT